MTNVIPTTILDQFIIEKTPGAFLEDATKTAIDHAGNLVLPIATLQTVEEHTENAEITTNGYVPGKLTISHSEYAYNTGYSAMGVRIAAGNLETIVTNTLMASMLKKMDGICLDAVAGLSYIYTSVVYAVLNVIFSVIACVITLAPIWTLVVHIILLAVFAIRIIGSNAASDYVNVVDKKAEDKHNEFLKEKENYWK